LLGNDWTALARVRQGAASSLDPIGAFRHIRGMVAQTETLQRIARLTPLGDVLAMLADLAQPVTPVEMEVSAALGSTLAGPATAPAARPPQPIALRDGWAVRSDDLTDASAYAPVPLPQEPVWLETGDPLPATADAIAPVESVLWRGTVAEVVTPVAPGDGVLAAGADVATGSVLRPAGARLRRSDLAVLQAIGIARVMVRAPRIALVGAGAAHPIRDAALAFLTAAIAAEGCVPAASSDTTADRLDRVLHDATVDAVLVVGGTGSGRRDASVRALARNGRIAVHGIAISPGETAAFGAVGTRPVLLVPGRLDAAIAIWLMLGLPLLASLAGKSVVDTGLEFALMRKVSSSLGLSEVVLVQRGGEKDCEPLASGYLSLAALARADGWILVPPESEGFAAGSCVTVRPLP
jgi:molybdopterin biosynthesis enzyme